ncbi:hypothetical protein ACGFZA_32580 [Streptomyces sp. NPDC048211]|uniref:hypothetical protein n=1 Tax=Streptomyces sp. NPDC048211 TaxID=3365516 RepID=UPI0037199DC8
MASNPPASWWASQLTPERRALHFIEYTAAQIDQLAPLLPDGLGMDEVVRAACIESFWVNVRLLTEFLTHDKEKRDWRAVDFVPGWATTDAEAKSRLKDAWVLASRHVMHLSKDRTPDHDAVTPVTAEQYQQVARDCRAVYNELLTQWV